VNPLVILVVVLLPGLALVGLGFTWVYRTGRAEQLRRKRRTVRTKGTVVAVMATADSISEGNAFFYVTVQFVADGDERTLELRQGINLADIPRVQPGSRVAIVYEPGDPNNGGIDLRVDAPVLA
jgi:hypothetical protein